MPAKKEISLLPDKENANSFINRIIKWTTSIGRAIIIVTELIVISAFLSRFWLDRKNSDLSEVIRQQKAILESTQDFEKEYGFLQQRLKALAPYANNPQSLDIKISSVVSSIPNDISLGNISIKVTDTGQSATLTAIAYKEGSIVDFITNLSINPDIQKVDIKRIEKKSKDDKYNVDLDLNFKAQGGKT